MNEARKVKPVRQLSRLCRMVFPAILLCASGSQASPTLGAHALAFYPCGGSGGLSTAPVNTQTSGSTILTWVGRGALSAFTPATVPVDNKTNTYSLLGSVHQYTVWPGTGQAIYAAVSATGGSNHIFTAPMIETNEITMAAIEVKNGGVIQDVEWNELTTPASSQTSLNVTTTGPATLVAIWTGDSSSDSETAIPSNGFTTIDSELLASCDFQAVVATKDVATAGSYNVTWFVTPNQGAQIILVAVQSAPPPALQAQVAGGNIVISWPALAAGYGLEMTSNLLMGNFWTPVTNVPAIVGSQDTVTNTIYPGTGFYRLMRP